MAVKGFCGLTSCRVISNRALGFYFIISCIIVVIVYARTHLTALDDTETGYYGLMILGRIMPPKKTGAAKLKQIISLHPLPDSSTDPWREMVEEEQTRTGKLNILSTVLQRQLKNLERASCSNYTLLCGCIFTCGLTCQLHHHANCVLLSYIMGIPLIHDAKFAWASKTPWAEVYKKIGSSCKENEKTIFVNWENGSTVLRLENECKHSSDCPAPPEFQYPLSGGVPIHREIYEILRANHDDPFLWYIGQFMKYTTRLSSKMKGIVKETAENINFTEVSRAVGFHVRRTDKMKEAINSVHSIEDYVKPAERYFTEFYSKEFQPRTVYVASDDHTVLHDARRNYTLPEWNMIGVPCNHTYHNEGERRSEAALRNIVQDIHFLSQCESIVCGLSSNVCRLLYELLGAKYPDVRRRLTSLDPNYAYQYYLMWGSPPTALIPV